MNRGCTVATAAMLLKYCDFYSANRGREAGVGGTTATLESDGLGDDDDVSCPGVVGVPGV